MAMRSSNYSCFVNSSRFLSGFRRTLQVSCVLAAALSVIDVAEAAVVTYTNLGAWQTAVTGSSVVDFEGISHGSLSNQVPGLTFSASNGGDPRVSSAVSAQSGVNVMEVNPQTFGAFDGGGGVTISFATLQAAVSISYLDSQFAGNTITLLDGSNNVIASYELQYPHPDEWLFAGFVSSSGADISQMQISVDSADYVAFDDLLYAPRAAPVPEPGSLTLFGMGLVSLACGWWRARRSSQLPLS